MSYTAEFVTTENEPDGVTLAGTLRRPTVATASEIGVDVMVMHHGVGGNFYRSAMFDRLSESLLAVGCAVLRVNNRGHELLTNGQQHGRPTRLGAAFEVVAECVHDWRAWTDFAAAQGFSRIGVWGHSLGGVKTIYSLATDPDSRVPYAISSSPPRFAYEMFLAGPDADEFRAQYDLAQNLVDQAKGGTLMEITLPTRAVVAASTVVDKYGPAARYDVVRHLPKVRTPLLVTVGGLEATGPQRIAFAEHEPVIGQLATTQPNLAFHLVPEADHFYTGQENALWQAVREWTERARTPVAAR